MAGKLMLIPNSNVKEFACVQCRLVLLHSMRHVSDVTQKKPSTQDLTSNMAKSVKALELNRSCNRA